MKANVEILFEDNHLLVVNKPAGLLTQQDHTNRENLEEFLRRYLKDKRQKESVFLHAIHRLDRVTSGVCVFAKSSKALSRLQESLKKREVKKNYFALVDTKPLQNEGSIALIQEKGAFKASVSQTGKKSLLHYTLMSEQEGYFLLKIDLVTGRYHQIRLSLSEKKMPILGDQKYRSEKKVDFDGICLHQGSFTIQHPTTKEEIKFEAPFPKSVYWDLFRQTKIF